MVCAYLPYPQPELLYCLLKARSYDTVSPSLPLQFSTIAKLSKTNLQRNHCILNYNQHMLNVICHLSQQLQFKHKQDISHC